MKSRIRLLAALAVLLGTVAGCSNDVLVGRYQEAICQEPNSKPTPCHYLVPKAEVSVVTLKTPAAAQQGGSGAPNLPERALAAYIQALAEPKMSPSAAALRQNLAAPLKGSESSKGPPSVADRTLFQRTIIVTVAKAPPFNPADRLEATDVQIDMHSKDATFRSWDNAATAYTTINAGTLQVTSTRNFETSLSLGAPTGSPIVASGAEKAVVGKTRVENYTATSQVDNLTISVANKRSDNHNISELRIRRQGGVGVDLTGNTIIKVEMALGDALIEKNKPVFSISGSYRKKNKWVSPEKLTLKPRFINVGVSTHDIDATVHLIYTVRHIVSGDNTLEDEDDRVREETITAEPINDVTLIPADEVAPPSLGLWLGPPGKDFPVFVQGPEFSRAFALCFDSYEEADQLLAYLRKGNRTRPEVLGDARLGIIPPPVIFKQLQPQNVDQLSVRADCP